MMKKKRKELEEEIKRLRDSDRGDVVLSNILVGLLGVTVGFVLGVFLGYKDGYEDAQADGEEKMFQKLDEMEEK